MEETSKLVNGPQWNVLTGRWIEYADLDGFPGECSPLEALERSGEIRKIVQSSPIDLFAAHRFLLTLLYWKAEEAGGVEALRRSLLGLAMPRRIIQAIRGEEPRFRLFGGEAPFLQDPSADPAKSPKPVGSLFAEFATGTNVAHFHHGDDRNLRLCARCATLGMMRVIPWSQSGGAGLTPSIHNAPPVFAIATGRNLTETLGHNLFPLSAEPGTARWSGHFTPADPAGRIPFLEAFTWNPRVIRLPLPERKGSCARCGRADVETIGPIAFAKNDRTKKRADKLPFEWRDPAAFYDVSREDGFTTYKSSNEETAALGLDLLGLVSGKRDFESQVTESGADGAAGWTLVVPSTNPANNKTYDHRRIDGHGDVAAFIRALGEDAAGVPAKREADGWVPPPIRRGGASAFVRAAVRWFDHADWSVLSNAAFKRMRDAPAALDLMTGVLWPLRSRGVAGLPSRDACWLTLKLMASVPARSRVPVARAAFLPLDAIPKRQPDRANARRKRGALVSYPLSFPRGVRLESALRRAIDTNLRKKRPHPIDWAGLCHALSRLPG